jgi:hypothetical protein
MLELNPQQLSELRSAGERPMTLTDPETHDEYVVLKSSVYDWLKRVSESIDASLYEFEDLPADS